jgi:glycosyltransferase involved in cell wall biosynthesis
MKRKPARFGHETIARHLRIGVVSTSFPVSINPASGIFVQRLVQHLPNGILTTVLIPCPPGDCIRDIGESTKVRCFSYGPRSMLRLAHRPGGIPDAIRRRDPALLLLPIFVPAMLAACIRLAAKVDVIHGNWSGPGFIAAIAGRLVGTPSIVTLRGSDVERAKTSLVFRWILLACVCLNLRVVVVSEEIQNEVRRRFPKYAQRVEFIPNGASVGDAVPSETFRNPTRLLTVSNLIRSKRVDVLLRALVADGASRNVVLRIVGDGPERKQLEELATRLNISERVEFAGPVLPNEVQGHLSWADIFVFASESEGRPNVILEAMAAGLPIVSTTIPGVRELLLDHGILVPPGDSERFASAIRLFIDDPSGAIRVGRAAMQSLNERGLTWEQTGARYGALYREIVGE